MEFWARLRLKILYACVIRVVKSCVCVTLGSSRAGLTSVKMGQAPPPAKLEVGSKPSVFTFESRIFQWVRDSMQGKDTSSFVCMAYCGTKRRRDSDLLSRVLLHSSPRPSSTLLR
jgi:hypothetical protein